MKGERLAQNIVRHLQIEGEAPDDNAMDAISRVACGQSSLEDELERLKREFAASVDPCTGQEDRT